MEGFIKAQNEDAIEGAEGQSQNLLAERVSKQKGPQEGRRSFPGGFRSWLDKATTTLTQCWSHVSPEVPPTSAAMGCCKQGWLRSPQVSSSLCKW